MTPVVSAPPASPVMPAVPIRRVAVVPAAPVQAIAAVAAVQVTDSVADAQKVKQKLICHSCAEPVPYNVAKFCWFNKPKFGGNLYCIECQKKV